MMARTERIRTQQRHTRNKLYALHAPEVECISKGKARNRYEFGVKVSLVGAHAQRPHRKPDSNATPGPRLSMLRPVG